MTDFDHNAIDEVLQSRVRIAIVAFLASTGNVDFAGIRDAIKTSDGNTSVHLRKLETPATSPWISASSSASRRRGTRSPTAVARHCSTTWPISKCCCGLKNQKGRKTNEQACCRADRDTK
jgi:hypothetical protein